MIESITTFSDRLRERIDDAGIVRPIQAHLNSGIMSVGVVLERYQGTPQGGPLSPLLVNVMLDEWLRHRLRAIQLKHWKRGSTIHRESIHLGAAKYVARRVAGYSPCWWRNSDGDIKRVLAIAYFDRLGVPVSHDINFSNRPVWPRMPGGVGWAR